MLSQFLAAASAADRKAAPSATCGKAEFWAYFQLEIFYEKLGLSFYLLT